MTNIFRHFTKMPETKCHDYRGLPVTDTQKLQINLRIKNNINYIDQLIRNRIGHGMSKKTYLCDSSCGKREREREKKKKKQKLTAKAH